MRSRFLFQTAIALGALMGLVLSPCQTNAADDGRQYYELRIYKTKSEQQQLRINEYWQRAAVPAYNRLGVQPVGVFTESQESPTNNIYVVVPFDSLAAFERIPDKLAADVAYQNIAADFLAASKTNAAYEGMESSLLVAFNGMKHIAIPPADRKPNIFELRTYMSPSEKKGLNKIQMFESGEISLMKEVGLAPIFYGRKVVGSHLPCLVYMTCGENVDEHKKHWSAFNAAPVWKQLQADPQYKDNMIGMIQVILKRTTASEF